MDIFFCKISAGTTLLNYFMCFSMKKILLSLLTLSCSLLSFADGQNARISSTPSPAVSNKPLEVTITTGDLGSTVYCYSWVENTGDVSLTPSWGWDDVNTSDFRMSGSGGTYTFKISDIKAFYGLTDDQLANLKKIGFIAKTSFGNQTQDLFIDVVQGRRDAYSGGEGSLNDPFIIKTANDLKMLAATSSDWSAGNYFRMEADIDASGLTSSIGSASAPFAASFDGNGHAVLNLSLSGNALGMPTGLFAVINGGEVKNLGVVNAMISGSNSVGIIAGELTSGIIECCFSSGSVAGSSICVGGLVGENVSGRILNCYSGADVENSSDYATGGLVGKNRGTIQNTYSAGKVKGYDYVGGLIGANFGTIKNSIALNHEVTAPYDFTARFGGNNNTRNIADGNYSWENILAGHVNWTNHGDHGILKESKSLANETEFRTLSHWDFDNVWEWVMKNNVGYPLLRNLSNQECYLSDRYFTLESGIDEITEGRLVINVSPNPTQGLINICGVAGVGSYTLYSVNGQLIAQGDGAGNNTVSIDFSGSPSGLYILMVSDSQGNKEIFKIIKN